MFLPVTKQWWEQYGWIELFKDITFLLTLQEKIYIIYTSMFMPDTWQ